ncbi:Two component, sigma54 specific, transcriptional regulator, Fis family [Desulfamplus magnetovallimortis]|uniref:DNA-binding transcriptional regulator NtrC n=1 Tax=Desulfamplus magnetovallimortis TaxID=1246637 RepID=A0A1W1HJ46_9BACT|nr:sigma-54 dependent transcriptional regulator [Desulfamplus magnetovallimortis]SLM32537.1 Two component, sigma54 specific, transcriptional regulator, Fis family [Desulfamplus magnetovallimortis]
MNTILVIDDDDQLRISFCKLLREEQYDVIGAASGEAGIEIVQQKVIDLVILDMRLPGMNGMETFIKIKEIDSRLPVIIVTAFGTTEIAIEATKMGAYDYVLKPFDVPEMLTLIKQAIEAGYCMRAPVAVDAEPGLEADVSGDAIIGQSRLMQNVYKAIGMVSKTDATVLIRGESGTGKELVARAVYQHGIRANKAFLIINCVAIPENLLESELFGYEKGAFTGASQRHIGKIEQANGGTVFLDEIGDMPLNIQAKILRLLQEKNIERLGGEETIPVDVRIIAATNKHLEQAIEDGSFREDLYFRLKVVTIELPPLRERKEDIENLVNHYISKFSMDLKIDNPGIQKQAMSLLSRYEWPGNIRELSNMVHKLLIFNRGAPVSAFDVEQIVNRKEDIRREKRVEMSLLNEWVRQLLSDPSEPYRFDDFMDTLARIVISEALELTNGNRSQAAKILGISRPTLHARIEKYQIHCRAQVVS